jgi:hypothetical protein
MPHPRTTRRKLIIGLGGAAATLAATAALAVAQVVPNPPDGSPPAPLPPSNVITTTCGPNQTSIVKTETSPSITNSVNWVPLPGAATQVVVPDGQSRCIKVLLTAETVCEQTNAADFCYVRALVDGVPMDPNGAGFQAIDSEDGTASAHGYEWIKRVGEGPHIVRIERRVGNAATAFWADDWTFDVSLYL